MRRKLSERERRRIATRRENNGEDFDSRNARHAASFSKTKFNSNTGSAAAKLRWQRYREEKARKVNQQPNDNDQGENDHGE